ncbi:basic region leucine zipper [Oesophagostomum dentatum]|uniref:Basic region leucine zipper n=1 Tax=Oesophagostomum dentatum TaxID=61180 RepID=A0A0B1T594_OESDE|nr:basic region leucine zipper [Oesophagostomum dentatum]
MHYSNPASPSTFSEGLRSPNRTVLAYESDTDPKEGHLLEQQPYDDKHHSCHCLCEQWTDQSSIELIVTSTNLVTMNNSSDHTSKMNDDVAQRFLPNADWQFDATDWPQVENFSYESPPYSHEIYAGSSPSIGCYPVDLNEIDAALDCDISTLDAYLHSPPSCSTSTELLPHTQPPVSSTASTQASAPQPSSTLDAEPLEEFFPDLCEVTTAPPAAPQQPERRRKVSVASTRSSTSRYSPYSIESAPQDADAAYSEYRLRRDKNNLASQRSRQKRVEKMRQMKDEKETLERRNIELKTLLSSLEVQVADYKRMVLMFVQKSA